jgi:hypothetical protein
MPRGHHRRRCQLFSPKRASAIAKVRSTLCPRTMASQSFLKCALLVRLRFPMPPPALALHAVPLEQATQPTNPLVRDPLPPPEVTLDIGGRGHRVRCHRRRQLLPRLRRQAFSTAPHGLLGRQGGEPSPMGEHPHCCEQV